MKTKCYFHFSGERRFRSEESRKDIAYLLLAYRANPNSYHVTKWAKGYMVRAANTSALAIIETR